MRKPKLTPAGHLERLFAFMLDVLLLLLLPKQLMVALFGTDGVVVLLGFLLDLAYFSFFLAGPWQATPAQRLLGIRVVKRDGTPLTLRDAVMRFLAFTLPVLPVYSSFFAPETAVALMVWLSLLWYGPILIREERTGIHDQWSGSRVVAGKA